MKDFEYTIGIGVTTHNRPEVLKNFMKNIEKYMPKNAKFVIVDDASSVPVKNATYRFTENAGIAKAKNKCLELLQDCNHIFLFDDDCWPKKDGWWKPYVEGKEPHYSYIFKDFINAKLGDCVELYRDSGVVAYSHARGCMLYFDHICLDKIGGYDTGYRRWGYEHVDISNRIYNSGLTLFRFMDVPNSSEYIHSEDEHQAVAGTVSREERIPYLQEMKFKFENSFKSSQYMPYGGKNEEESKGTEDIVLASYFTGQIDTQRNMQWETNIEDIRVLMDSMNGQKLVILHDCFTGKEKVPDNVELVKVEAMMNPYFQRWLSEYDYLRQHPEVRRVFHVDSTDVEMLHNPFPHMENNKLYVGSEASVLNNAWMIKYHPIPFLRLFFRQNARKQLLNCGLVGGTRKDVMNFMRAMNTKYFDEKANVGPFEMGLFNYIARTQFESILVTGPLVHTPFKTFTKAGSSWWRHK